MSSHGNLDESSCKPRWAFLQTSRSFTANLDGATNHSRGALLPVSMMQMLPRLSSICFYMSVRPWLVHLPKVYFYLRHLRRLRRTFRYIRYTARLGFFLLANLDELPCKPRGSLWQASGGSIDSLDDVSCKPRRVLLQSR